MGGLARTYCRFMYQPYQVLSRPALCNSSHLQYDSCHGRPDRRSTTYGNVESTIGYLLKMKSISTSAGIDFDRRERTTKLSLLFQSQSMECENDHLDFLSARQCTGPFMR